MRRRFFRFSTQQLLLLLLVLGWLMAVTAQCIREAYERHRRGVESTKKEQAQAELVAAVKGNDAARRERHSSPERKQGGLKMMNCC